jgi:hypothetical protein
MGAGLAYFSEGLVFVQSFPVSGTKWQVSSGTGALPKFLDHNKRVQENRHQSSRSS